MVIKICNKDLVNCSIVNQVNYAPYSFRIGVANTATTIYLHAASFTKALDDGIAMHMYILPYADAIHHPSSESTYLRLGIISANKC